MKENPIREARRAKLMSQRELAHLVGVTHSQISAYESGRYSARLRFDKIADALRIDFELFWARYLAWWNDFKRGE